MDLGEQVNGEIVIAAGGALPAQQFLPDSRNLCKNRLQIYVVS